MKKLLPISLLLAFVAPASVFAQPFYECQVVSDAAKGRPCEADRGRIHACQIYDSSYKGGSIPSFCLNQCVDRSGIPEDCAVVIVAPSRNPEAHQGRSQVIEQTGLDPEDLGEIGGEVRDRLSGIENEINTDDGVDSDEVSYVVGRIVDVIKDIFKEKIGGAVTGVKDKIKDIIPGGDDEDELTEEDFMDTGLDSTQPGEYKTEKWPDEDGVKIAKIVDPYGIERYTSDGKHFYDNPYSAAHSGEGLRSLSNGIKDSWRDFTGFFSFRGKLKDKDKELQRQIAREVLDDAKSQRDKDVEKAYEKLSDKVKVPTFGDVPAKVVIESMKEASATDFAGGALRYIEERKGGMSPAGVRENYIEELSAGYGSFGEGVSLSTANKQAEAVIFARYEEVYQRYLLAKEFGRED